ncbi:MAG TPA: hypothetical protein VJ085_02590, partial [Candidatus Acidoferrales bacterium]|nr:hypothetical protein [Candidatus Acidoferrales bacterium]
PGIAVEPLQEDGDRGWQLSPLLLLRLLHRATSSYSSGTSACRAFPPLAAIPEIARVRRPRFLPRRASGSDVLETRPESR